MTYIFSILSISVHFILTFNFPEAEVIDRKMEESSSVINFELVNGMILLEAQAESKSGYYILDTGTPSLILNQKVTQGKIDLWSVHGGHRGKQVTLSNFQFGAIEKNDIDAWALDLSFVEEIIDHKVAGIIGSDFLSEHKLLIDYANNVIVLEQSDNLKLTLGNPDQYHITTLSFIDQIASTPVVQVEIDSKPFRMAFDTGAAVNFLYESLEDRTDEYGYQTMNLALNHIKVENAQFETSLTTDFQPNKSDQVDGILSVPSLNTSKVVVDYRKTRIHLFWSK